MTTVWEKPPISFFRVYTAADFLCSLYGEIGIWFNFLLEFKISRESVHWKQRRRRKDLLCKTIPDLMRVHFLCEFSSRYMQLRITPGRLPQATLPYFSTYRKWNRIWRQRRASWWAYITDLGWQKASVTCIQKALAGSHQCFQKEAMTQTWTRLCLIWFYQDS